MSVPASGPAPPPSDSTVVPGGRPRPSACLTRLPSLSIHSPRSSRVRELRLYDVANTAGVAGDLSHISTAAHVTAHTGPQQLGDALYGAHLVVIPAGVPRKPGMTRDDLFNINAGASSGRLVGGDGSPREGRGGAEERGGRGAAGTSTRPVLLPAILFSAAYRRTPPSTCAPAPPHPSPLPQALCAPWWRAWRATAPAPGWPSSQTRSTPPCPSRQRCARCTVWFPSCRVPSCALLASCP